MAFGEKFAAGFSSEFGPTYRQAGAQHLASRERQRDRAFQASESQKNRDERERLYQRRYGNTGQEAAELQIVGGFLAELQNPESPLVQDPAARYGTLVELARTVTTPRAHSLLRQFPQLDQQLRFNQRKQSEFEGYSQRLALTEDGGQAYQQELQRLQMAPDEGALNKAIGDIQKKQIEAIRLDRANQAKQGASELLQGLAQVPGISPEVRGSVEMAFFALQRGFLDPQRVLDGIEQGLNLAFNEDYGQRALVSGFRQFPGATGSETGQYYQRQPVRPELQASLEGGQGARTPGMERVLGRQTFEKAPVSFQSATTAQRRTIQRRMAKAMTEGGSRAALEVLLESGMELKDVPDEFYEAVKQAARKERVANESPSERLRRYGREIFG